MINDIFKMFGEQTAEILFEIITECMDDYLYIFDLQNNTFEISQSAVKRFNMSKNLLTDAANEVMKVVYEEDAGCLQSILRIYAKEEKRYIIFITGGLIKKVCRSGSLRGIVINDQQGRQSIWSDV